MTPLLAATPRAWLDAALADFDAVLCDHAHCEKKAAATALSLVNDYPEEVDLVRRLTKLAGEELRHFRQVYGLIVARGLVLGRDRGDPYAKALAKSVRTSPALRRTDRLLVASLIEARSAERLGLLGAALPNPQLRAFYGQLAAAEAGHHWLFVDLATQYGDRALVEERLDELARRESEIVADLPLLPRIH